MNATNLEPGYMQALRLFVFIRILFWCVLRAMLWLWALEMLVKLTAARIDYLLTMDLLLLGSLMWRQVRLQLGRYYLPVVLVAAWVPLLIGNYWWPTANPLLTPLVIFFFALLVFIAWQYTFRYVVYYVVALSLFQTWLMWPIELQTITIDLGWMLMYAAMLLIAGYMIVHLTTIQRTQRAALSEAYAQQAAANVKLQQYAATMEELTISRERNRLARELHDTLAHSLSAVTLQLEAVRSLWGVNPAGALQMLDRADESARTGLMEARRALQALRASPLQDLGLELALEAMAETAAERSGAHLSLHIQEGVSADLPVMVEQGIYRIAQEALENVVRHAQAERIVVYLKRDDANLTMIIEDDGKGMDLVQSLEDTGRTHFGIRGIQERATRLGGRLELDSVPEQGTRVCLTLPSDVIRRHYAEESE